MLSNSGRGLRAGAHQLLTPSEVVIAARSAAGVALIVRVRVKSASVPIECGLGHEKLLVFVQVKFLYKDIIV